MFPACYFARFAFNFHGPFGLQAPRPGSVRPNPRRFLACRPVAASASGSRTAPPASTPLRDFYLPRDQSVPLVGRPAACLPIPPDLRSLPAALNYLTSNGLRITVPGPLRFRRLAVPQTSWNLHQYEPARGFRQSFFVLQLIVSSSFIHFVFMWLQGNGRVSPVHKPRSRQIVFAILKPPCAGS